MKQKLIEQSVLFASVVKWFLISSFIGVVIGAMTTLFLNILGWSTFKSAQWPWYFLMLPLGMFVSSLLIFYLCPEAEGHGTEQVIEAVHKRSGKIQPMVVPVKLVATIITLASGGSAGKEGPCAQIGAGISSIFADLIRSDDLDRAKLVICGISAGFASVFGTPIAGAIFGVEVLAVGRLQYAVLFPAFVAGIMAFQTSSYFGIKYFYHPVRTHIHFSEIFIAEVVLIGIACGLCSFAFIEILNFFHNLSHKLKMWKPFKGIVGGFAVILSVLVSTRYLGLGLKTIEQTLIGTYTATWYDVLLKMLTTAITLGFGGSGGIVTPIFFIGTTFGSVLSTLLHQPQPVLAALGMVGLLAGCANTPVAASIMAIELFGTDFSSYAALVCVISFLLTGHRSVYHSQILALKKSDSLEIAMNKSIHETEPPEFHFREKHHF